METHDRACEATLNLPGVQVSLTTEVDEAKENHCALIVAVDIADRAGWPNLGGMVRIRDKRAL